MYSTRAAPGQEQTQSRTRTENKKARRGETGGTSAGATATFERTTQAASDANSGSRRRGVGTTQRRKGREGKARQLCHPFPRLMLR